MQLGIGNSESGIRVRILNSKFLILNCICLACLACGRKGPPLPPLVRVPVAPEELTATRRGDTVEIDLTVPAANTDKTRPANIERVDVYAMTAVARPSDAAVVEQGDRVASVDVKAPSDPNRTIDPDDPASDLEPLGGDGLDQGARTKVFEDLAADALAVPTPAPGGNVEDGLPLPGAPCQIPTRSYVGVGISTDGRRGPLSRAAAVPLTPAPPPPGRPAISYDQTGVTVTWTETATDKSAPGGEGVLPSRPIGCGAPDVGYHVYEVGAKEFETRLTDAPVAGAPWVDRRVEWGIERCYAVRRVQTIGGLSLESEPSAPACEKLADTFPPAAPAGLVAVASEGAINLIWDPNAEPDLAGYIVLRAPAASRDFAAVTPAPIQDTTFTDAVPPGTPFVYAIQAVDASGNRSASSAESTPETAR